MEQESFSFKKMEEVLQEDVDWHNNGNEVLTYNNDGIDVVISNDRHLRIAFNLAASLGVKRPTWYIKLRDNLNRQNSNALSALKTAPAAPSINSIQVKN